MNRLNLYKDDRNTIFGGIITKIEDVYIKGKNVYIITLNGTKFSKENGKFITGKDAVKIYFSNTTTTENKMAQLYDRIKKANPKLSQYLVVNAEKSKKYERIAYAKDFGYVNNIFTLPPSKEKSVETNVVVGMVKSFKEFESCFKVTLIQKKFENGSVNTYWPVVTLFKKNNIKMVNAAKKLLCEDEKGKKYASFICGPNKPYKGNPNYVADTFEVINLDELKETYCNCNLL